MATFVDDRENLEPGAGITGAPAPDQLIGADPFAGYNDYFGFDEEETWFFPDGRQWIKFKKMNEGARAKFSRLTRPDITINQKSGDAKIPFDQANERKQLILSSVVDWHIVTRNPKTQMLELVPFSGGTSSGGNLSQWIDKANPALVAELEKAIRKANPWMLAEMSVKDIDREISDLQELRKAAVEREEREEAFR
jgi:hypothetical protein